MAKLNVAIIYKEERSMYSFDVVEWDKSKGMRGLKWQIAKKVAKEEKLKFTLRDGEGKMLRKWEKKLRCTYICCWEKERGEQRKGRKEEKSKEKKEKK
eukprot:gene1083-420_t